jgi:hypothetical protein
VGDLMERSRVGWAEACHHLRAFSLLCAVGEFDQAERERLQIVARVEASLDALAAAHRIARAQ